MGEEQNLPAALVEGFRGFGCAMGFMGSRLCSGLCGRVAGAHCKPERVRVSQHPHGLGIVVSMGQRATPFVVFFELVPKSPLCMMFLCFPSHPRFSKRNLTQQDRPCFCAERN